MKPRFAANVSILFGELPFAERFGAAARAGFEGVEFWWPEEPLDVVIEAARGHEVVLVNFDGGSLADGERGYVNDPARAEVWRAHVPEAVAFARAVGCGRMNALVGLALPDVPREAQLAQAAEQVRFAARAAAPITVLIEAINTRDHGPYLVSSTAEAASFVRAVGEPNVALQFDVFHMARMGEDVFAALREYIDVIAHVQIADHPGRGEPGSGSFDFDALHTLLDELGYDGWVSAEYRPTGATEASLGWLR